MENVKDPIDIYPRCCLDYELSGTLEPVTVQVDNFLLEAWLEKYKETANYTRLLRYYLSSLLLDLNEEDTVFDVGSGDMVYASIIGDRVKRVILNDISIAAEARPENVLMAEQNIFEVDFSKYNINKIVVGHTIEHFRGNNDIKIIELLGKVLPKKGVCCIEPIFLGACYLEVFSYDTDEYYDPRAKQISTKDSKFPGRKDRNMGFARIYDSQALNERIIKVAKESGLDCKLITFKINGDYLPDMDKYVFKRKNINYPLRAMVLTKN